MTGTAVSLAVLHLMGLQSPAWVPIHTLITPPASDVCPNARHSKGRYDLSHNEQVASTWATRLQMPRWKHFAKLECTCACHRLHSASLLLSCNVATDYITGSAISLLTSWVLWIVALKAAILGCLFRQTFPVMTPNGVDFSFFFLLHRLPFWLHACSIASKSSTAHLSHAMTSGVAIQPGQSAAVTNIVLQTRWVHSTVHECNFCTINAHIWSSWRHMGNHAGTTLCKHPLMHDMFRKQHTSMLQNY